MAIEQNLRSHGYDFRKNNYVAPPLQPGIRIKGQLSFRGKKKAQELFARLDEDKDNKLQYEDFRGILCISLLSLSFKSVDLCCLSLICLLLLF